MDWTYDLEEYYEKLNDVPLPPGVSKFTFGSDILIVDVLLNYNIKAISTHSIFTEYTHVFNLNDFQERDEDSGSFDIDSDKVEIYLVDYTNVTDSVIKHSGVIKYIDEGKVSNKQAREIFNQMIETGKSAKELIEASGASLISDLEVLRALE